MLISSVCLVHCLALPALLAFVPALAVWLPGDRWVHPLLILLAVPVTGIALWRGYVRHRRPLAAVLGAIGLLAIILALATGSRACEAAITVLGGLLIASAHILNLRCAGTRPSPSESLAT
ncbi:MAG: MerC domain-containing protein [Sphingobium sp.]